MIVALLSAALLLAGPPEGNAGDNMSIAPLFSDDSLLSVTIRAPLTTLMTDRPDEQYLGGTFSYVGEDGEEHTLDLKLRTRGNYRRQEKHCDFTPIRLNFRRSQVAGTLLAGQDKLKLVTHCRNTKRYYEQLLLREFLAYRILQLMTTKSFSVRLMQITYIDTEGGKPLTKLGFVIEDDDDVAARHGMNAVQGGDISSRDLDRRQQNLVNVFQYLIGNTEYSLSIAEPGKYCCHNSDLMAATEGPPFIPLPYDFDFAGIVNAHYAEPNPRYDLRDVRQRLYKGECENNDLLPATFQLFHDRKDAIYGIVNELDLFSSRSRRDATAYLDRFYDHISKPKTVTRKFINKCHETKQEGEN